MSIRPWDKHDFALAMAFSQCTTNDPDSYTKEAAVARLKSINIHVACTWSAQHLPSVPMPVRYEG